MFRSAVALASLIVYRSIQRSGWDPWVVEGVPATEPALPNNAAYPPHPTTPPYWKASTPSTTHGSHPPEPYSSVCCNTQWATPTWTYATADLNIAAFIILPGLIERCRPAKRLRLIELLKSITTDPDFATETALLAIAEESHIKAHKERLHPPPTADFWPNFWYCGVLIQKEIWLSHYHSPQLIWIDAESCTEKHNHPENWDVLLETSFHILKFTCITPWHMCTYPLKGLGSASLVTH